MVRSSNNSFVWLTGFGLCTLLYSVKLSAIPNHDLAGVPGHLNQSDPRTTLSTLWATPQDSSFDKLHHTETSDSPFSIPCLIVAQKPGSSSGEVSKNLCDDNAAVGQSLSTDFGHIRGDRSVISGNYDGFNIGYQVSNGFSFRGFAGYPDLNSKAKNDSSKYLYGLNTKFRNSHKTWMIESYYLEQNKGKATPDKAIGSAFHYMQPTYSLMVLFDYGLYDNPTSAITTSGIWKLQENTQLSVALDMRNTPIQKHQQRYLQNAMSTTDGWTWDLPNDRIKKLVKRFSDGVTGMSFGLSHLFSEHLKIHGSVSVLHASAYQPKQTVSDSSLETKEYYYRLNISGMNWLNTGDSSKLDLHCKITESTKSTAASFDAQYPISRFWKFKPKIQTEITDNLSSHSVRSITSPALNMEYKSTNTGIQLEAGGKWELFQLQSEKDKSFSYYVSLGYKKVF